ncbi:MAG: ATP-dependent helicase [Rikenellaceae bacterium]
MADLFEYIETGHRNKIIMVGDSAQLPPVGYCESPALDISLMQMFCEPEYHTLSQVMRQGEDSGILYNATLVREMIESEYVDTPALHLSDDVIRVGGMDLIEMLEDSYSRYGKQGCAVITRSNKRANRFNQGIRQMILTHQEEIESGDLLMVVKNNYAPISESKDLDFIANGDMVMVRRIMKIEERYGFRFAYALLSLPDYDELSIERWIILDTLHVEAPSLNQQQQEQLFRGVEQEYMDITIKRKRIEKVLEDEFYNALQVKFAYAFTCHKAQGGQWHDIYIDTLLFGDEPMTMEFARWLYTAITRATGKVYFVGWDGSFFDNYIED